MDTDKLKLVLLGIFVVTILAAFMIISMILPPPQPPSTEGVIIDIQAETVK